MGKLDAQVAVITGAASGIDLEIARLFYREGAHIFLVDMNAEALRLAKAEFRNSDNRVGSCEADVTKSKMVDACVAKAVGMFGRVDIMVNGAGIGGRGMILDLTDEEWHRPLNVMLHGVFYGVRAAARQMVKQESGGKIINISSVASEVPLSGSISYCTAKAGVNMITKAAAVQLGEHNIRVNAIAPGEIETPLVQEHLDMPAWKESVIQKTPLGRVGQPTDVAEAALFLASDRSDWMTGHVLFVDGGQGMRGILNHKTF